MVTVICLFIKYFLSCRCCGVWCWAHTTSYITAGLCPSSWAVFGSVRLQRRVSNPAAVCSGDGGKLQCVSWTWGTRRVPERHGGPQTERTVSLQMQTRHEEGKKMSAYLLEYLPQVTGWVLYSMCSKIKPWNHNYTSTGKCAEFSE